MNRMTGLTATQKARFSIWLVFFALAILAMPGNASADGYFLTELEARNACGTDVSTRNAGLTPVQLFRSAFFCYHSALTTNSGNRVVRWAVGRLVDHWWQDLTPRASYYSQGRCDGGFVWVWDTADVYGSRCAVPEPEEPAITKEQLAKAKNNGCSTEDSKVGNPCNASNGNKHQSETDYRGGENTIELTRHYNSLETDNDSVFGFGWSSPFSHKRIEKIGPYLQVWDGTGRGEPFEKVSGVWTADADSEYTLVETANGYTLTNTSGTVSEFDSDGRLQSETDLQGRTTNYLYDSDDRVIEVTGPFGHSVSFEYDTNNRIKTATPPDGNSIDYTYDDAGNLIRVNYADGSSKTYHYENTSFPHYLTGITDENGDRYATYGYNADGKAILTEHAGGQEKFTIAYDSDTQTTVTDAAGTKVVYQFETVMGQKNLTSKINQADGKGISQSFDSRNNRSSKTDEEGRVTAYTYNASNQRTSMTEGAGAIEERTTEYEYLSPELDLPTVVRTPSVYLGATKTTTIMYGAQHNPVKITQSGFTPTGTPVSRTVTMQYNSVGQVIKIDGPRSDVNDVTTMAYYECATGVACGQLKRITNALGHTTTFDQYDTNGRVLQMTDASGLVTAYAYDVRGRLSGVTRSGSGVSPRTTQFEYDSAGQLAETVDPVGGTVVYDYNAAHELVSVTDSLGNHITYSYDSRGNRISNTSKDPDGSVARAVTRVFDARNRAIEINAGGSAFKQAFDGVGNLVSETDPNNNPATTHGHDTLDRLLATIDRLGGTSQYRYDVADRVSEVTAPNGTKTVYAYDDLGNRLSEHSPDRGLLAYQSDSAGNTTSITDARGIKVAYTYDALNRVVKADYPGTEEDVTYRYDTCGHGIGRLCEVTDQSGTTNYGYSILGKIVGQTWHTQGTVFETGYAYDTANRLVAMTYPDGRTAHYQRDIMGRVTQVSLERDGDIEILSSGRAYRADGLLTGQVFGNGISETRTYDTQGRLTTYSVGSTSRTYQFDANGNVLAISSPNQNSTYGYDALDRLTTDQWINAERNRSLTMEYDTNGNRLAVVENGEAHNYRYTPLSNRLEEANSRAVVLDASGNIASDHNGRRSFKYNQANRLFKVYRHGRLKAAYVYNAFGQRTSKILYDWHIEKDGDGHKGKKKARYHEDNDEDFRRPHRVTIYHYDLNGQLIAETNHLGELVKAYVWVDQVPLAQFDRRVEKGIGHTYGKAKHGWWEKYWGRHYPKERVTYLHTDHLGTPRLATDDKGETVWRWAGNAFGDSAPVRIFKNSSDEHRKKAKEYRERKDTWFINFRFPGQYYDAESGLHYNWNRYYDPRTGRYITSDPIGLEGGLNTYGYVGGNPLYYFDFTGLASRSNVRRDWNRRNGRRIPSSGSRSGLSSSVRMAMNWFTGTGPENRSFGPGSGPVNDMMNAPGVEAARAYYNNKNKNASGCGCNDNKAVTNYASSFGLSGLFQAGLNPTQQFVGSYRIDIYPVAGCKKKFVLTNTSSFRSFAYGAAPDWSRNSFGPMGNMSQTYWWTE